MRRLATGIALVGVLACGGADREVGTIEGPGRSAAAVATVEAAQDSGRQAVDALAIRATGASSRPRQWACQAASQACDP